MPLNQYLEIKKWHISVNRIYPQSLQQSFLQVMFGNAGAFITPYRLGEYPGRAYYIEKKDVFFTAVILGFVGTLALEIINIGLGIPASLFYVSNLYSSIINIQSPLPFYILVFILLLVLFISIPKIGNYIATRKLHKGKDSKVAVTLSQLDKSYLLNMLLLSLLRYLVYSFQLWLTLRFFNIIISPFEALAAIPTYYMLVSITPSMPIADPAIRGSWGIVVFQIFTTNTPSIAFAAITLWLINTAMPLLTIPFLNKKNKAE